MVPSIIMLTGHHMLVISL